MSAQADYGMPAGLFTPLEFEAQTLFEGSLHTVRFFVPSRLPGVRLVLVSDIADAFADRAGEPPCCRLVQESLPASE